MASTDDTSPKLKSRDDLVAALQFASILEHTLCCEYLFTGFSMRKSLDDYPTPKDTAQEKQFQTAIDMARPWQTQVYFIARQEMEHLAIATNLLAAVGEQPYFKRPLFPVERKKTLLDAPYCLERFNSMSLKTYIWFERPTYLTDSFPPDYLDRCKGDVALMKSSPSIKMVHEAVERFDIHSVEELYDEINTAFQTLPADEIFVGNTSNQVDDIFGYKVYMQTITNRVEAASAIQLIIEQGEGIGLDPLDSDAHFQRFTSMLTEYEEWLEAKPEDVPEPALPVLLNPMSKPHPDWPSNTTCYDCMPNVVGRGSTAEVMDYFNECYNLMMVMLWDFFHTYRIPNPPATAERGEQAAKYYAAFFPLMTMVIRPLGEIVARLPAGNPEHPNSNGGVNFAIDNALMDSWDGMNQKERLQEYLRWLRKLTEQAKRMAENAERYTKHKGTQVVLTEASFRHQMEFLAENLHSTRLHLKNIWLNKYE